MKKDSLFIIICILIAILILPWAFHIVCLILLFVILLRLLIDYGKSDKKDDEDESKSNTKD